MAQKLKIQKDQHIRVDEDYHRTVRSISGDRDMDMIDYIHEILMKDPKFRERHDQVVKIMKTEGYEFDKDGKLINPMKKEGRST